MALSEKHCEKDELSDSLTVKIEVTASHRTGSPQAGKLHNASVTEKNKPTTTVKNVGSKETSLYQPRTPTLLRMGPKAAPPIHNEFIFPKIKLETYTNCKPKPFLLPSIQRQFTFTGYDIMADIVPKPKVKPETELQKKMREHKECYTLSCKRLGTTPSTYISRHINDKELVVKSHPLGPDGIRALCISLVNNNRVEKLDLEDNAMGSEGALYITEMLKENDTITEVRIAGNLIKSRGTNAFAQLLQGGRNLHTLDVSGSGLEDSDSTVLTNLIETKSQLKVLNVSHNGIGEIGALDIGRAIAVNDSLRELDMSWNHIRGKGAYAIALGVKKNVSLKLLNLAWNGFANSGANALGKSLEWNRTLKSLDMSNNRIGIDGMKGLIKGLKQNDGLSTLKIGKNPLTPEVALTILRAIEDSEKCVLTVLDLSDIVVRADFLEKWEDIKRKRPLPLRIEFGAVMQATLVPEKDVEVIDWRDPVMRMFKFMHDKGYRIIDLLKRLDKDRSLSVDREELKMGLVTEKIPMTEAQLDEVITRLDTDKDGEVDLGEMIKGEREFRKKMKARMRKMLKSTKPDPTTLKLMQIEDL